MDVDDYCRQVEAYLCRKNDGHLVRIVGPTFELVSLWAESGIPIRVVFGGIDRYFERYYAKGPRRRPVRVDFCEADILDLFDRWRRAVGVSAGAFAPGDAPGARAGDPFQAAVGSGASEPGGGAGDDEPLPPDEAAGRQPARGRASLSAHLERVVARLTAARAGGLLPPALDASVERAAREIDTMRAEAKGARGEARASMLARLDALEAGLLDAAVAAAAPSDLEAMAREAELQLAPFRSRMSPEALAAATREATRRLARDRFALPVIGFAG